MLNQLQLPLSGIDKINESPALISFYQARDNFEDACDSFLTPNQADDQEDLSRLIAVPDQLPDNFNRGHLELWTERLQAATTHIQSGENWFGELCDIPSHIK